MTRSEAIGHLKNIAIYSFQDGYTDEARQAIDMAIKALEEPERKKGKWIYKYYVWSCSECGNCPTKGMGYVQRRDELYDFCPHCGAQMEVE